MTTESRCSWCNNSVYLDDDRTFRCQGCHLAQDQCNCNPNPLVRLLRRVASSPMKW